VRFILFENAHGIGFNLLQSVTNYSDVEVEGCLRRAMTALSARKSAVIASAAKYNPV
jgi:hypothetical protein